MASRPALLERYRRASDDTRRIIDQLLVHDADDQAWAEQIGPVYRQGDVALLLGKSRQAVSDDRRLLRLEMRSGGIGYPVFQFDGRRMLPGVAEVNAILGPAVATSWTVASWLTSAQPALNGATPLERLREGDVEGVTLAARRFASALGG
jgi:hypothetical protein